MVDINVVQQNTIDVQSSIEVEDIKNMVLGQAVEKDLIAEMSEEEDEEGDEEGDEDRKTSNKQEIRLK